MSAPRTEIFATADAAVARDEEPFEVDAGTSIATAATAYQGGARVGFDGGINYPVEALRGYPGTDGCGDGRPREEAPAAAPLKDNQLQVEHSAIFGLKAMQLAFPEAVSEARNSGTHQRVRMNFELARGGPPVPYELMLDCYDGGKMSLVYSADAQRALGLSPGERCQVYAPEPGKPVRVVQLATLRAGAGAGTTASGSAAAGPASQPATSPPLPPEVEMEEEAAAAAAAAAAEEDDEEEDDEEQMAPPPESVAAGPSTAQSRPKRKCTETEKNPLMGKLQTPLERVPDARIRQGPVLHGRQLSSDLYFEIFPPYHKGLGEEWEPKFKDAQRLLSSAFDVDNKDDIKSSVYRSGFEERCKQSLVAGLFAKHGGGDLMLCAAILRLRSDKLKSYMQITYQATLPKVQRRGLGRLFVMRILQAAVTATGITNVTVLLSDGIEAYWKKLGFGDSPNAEADRILSNDRTHRCNRVWIRVLSGAREAEEAVKAAAKLVAERSRAAHGQGGPGGSAAAEPNATTAAPRGGTTVAAGFASAGAAAASGGTSGQGHYSVRGGGRRPGADLEEPLDRGDGGAAGPGPSAGGKRPRNQGCPQRPEEKPEVEVVYKKAIALHHWGDVNQTVLTNGRKNVLKGIQGMFRGDVKAGADAELDMPVLPGTTPFRVGRNGGKDWQVKDLRQFNPAVGQEIYICVWEARIVRGQAEGPADGTEENRRFYSLHLLDKGADLWVSLGVPMPAAAPAAAPAAVAVASDAEARRLCVRSRSAAAADQQIDGEGGREAGGNADEPADAAAAALAAEMEAAGAPLELEPAAHSPGPDGPGASVQSPGKRRQDASMLWRQEKRARVIGVAASEPPSPPSARTSSAAPMATEPVVGMAAGAAAVAAVAAEEPATVAGEMAGAKAALLAGIGAAMAAAVRPPPLAQTAAEASAAAPQPGNGTGTMVVSAVPPSRAAQGPQDGDVRSRCGSAGGDGDANGKPCGVSPIGQADEQHAQPSGSPIHAAAEVAAEAPPEPQPRAPEAQYELVREVDLGPVTPTMVDRGHKNVKTCLDAFRSIIDPRVLENAAGAGGEARGCRFEVPVLENTPRFTLNKTKTEWRICGLGSLKPEVGHQVILKVWKLVGSEATRFSLHICDPRASGSERTAASGTTAAFQAAAAAPPGREAGRGVAGGAGGAGGEAAGGAAVVAAVQGTPGLEQMDTQQAAAVGRHSPRRGLEAGPWQGGAKRRMPAGGVDEEAEAAMRTAQADSAAEAKATEREEEEVEEEMTEEETADAEAADKEEAVEAGGSYEGMSHGGEEEDRNVLAEARGHALSDPPVGTLEPSTSLISVQGTLPTGCRTEQARHPEAGAPPAAEGRSPPDEEPKRPACAAPGAAELGSPSGGGGQRPRTGQGASPKSLWRSALDAAITALETQVLAAQHPEDSLWAAMRVIERMTGLISPVGPSIVGGGEGAAGARASRGTSGAGTDPEE